MNFNYKSIQNYKKEIKENSISVPKNTPEELNKLICDICLKHLIEFVEWKEDKKFISFALMKIDKDGWKRHYSGTIFLQDIDCKDFKKWFFLSYKLQKPKKISIFRRFLNKLKA